MIRSRTLPIRLAPYPGEALDSWWEAIAHRLGTTTGDVLTSVGLLPRGTSRPVDSGILGRLVTLLDQDQAAALAWSAGTTEDQVHAMSLAHYDQRAHILDRRRHRVEAKYVWGRARGSRYCPACLAAGGGRWLLRWRLGWSFACLDHHVLLVDACPRCSRTPRHFSVTTRHLLAPGRCHSPVEGDPWRARCGEPLDEVPALHLPAQGSVIAAQSLIEKAIASGQADFGAYREDPQPSLSLFGDLRALASIILSRAPERLEDFVPPQLMAVHQEPVPAGRRSFDPTAHTRPGRLAPQRAATAAVGVIAALHILEQPDAHQAGALLRQLIRDADGGIPLKAGHRWRHTSPVFDAIHLAAMAPRFNHCDQLRYRTADRMPRRPGPGAAALVAERARKIPTLLWPAWSARLCPPNGTLSRTIRPALSCYLLLIGGAGDFTTAARLLGPPTGDRAVSKVAFRLKERGCWTAISLALSALADYLDQNGSPIDYDRRRAIDYSDLLPTQAWAELCEESEIDAGGDRRHQFARALLFERTSGLPATLAPDAYAPRTNELRTLLRTFETVLTPELAHGLDRHALDFLARQGIRDEPATWQPPTDLLPVLDLPGCDLQQVDRGLLHKLVRQKGLTTAQAAASLQISHDAVRFVLQEHPAPDEAAREAMRQRGATVRRARAALPKDQLVRFYHDEYRTLRWIAEYANVSVDAIKELVSEYGLVRAGKATRSRKIDIDWLRTQRAAGRTYRELGAETGLSATMIGYLARQHGIPSPSVLPRTSTASAL